MDPSAAKFNVRRPRRAFAPLVRFRVCWKPRTKSATRPLSARTPR